VFLPPKLIAKIVSVEHEGEAPSPIRHILLWALAHSESFNNRHPIHQLLDYETPLTEEKRIAVLTVHKIGD
jgi:hypothetical protein